MIGKRVKQQQLANEMGCAVAAYSSHRIIDRGTNSFVMMSPGHSAFRTTVFVDRDSGKIFVGGDIRASVFAYGPPGDTLGLIRWIGDCTDLGYYVAQKAQIGTGISVYGFDSFLARAELADWFNGAVTELSDSNPAKLGLIQQAVSTFNEASEASESRDVLTRDLLSTGYDPESIHTLGDRLESWVVYAWAALNRLAELTRNETEEEHHRRVGNLPATNVLGKLFDRLYSVSGGAPDGGLLAGDPYFAPEAWLAGCAVPGVELRAWLREECQDLGISTGDMGLSGEQIRSLGLDGLSDEVGPDS